MSTSTLHPPRLAPIFAATPSVPGTPVHSIQTMRRKSAGHGGPLTKILVANRGVRFQHDIFHVPLHASLGNRHPRLPHGPRTRDAYRRDLFA